MLFDGLLPVIAIYSYGMMVLSGQAIAEAITGGYIILQYLTIDKAAQVLRAYRCARVTYNCNGNSLARILMLY